MTPDPAPDMAMHHEAVLVVGWSVDPEALLAYMRREDGPWTGHEDDEVLACAQLLDLGEWHMVLGSGPRYYLSATSTADSLAVDLLTPDHLAAGRGLATLLGVPAGRSPVIRATSLRW